MAGRHLARLHLGDRRQIRHHLPLPGKAAAAARASTKSADWPGAAAARSRRSTSRSTAASTGSARELQEPVLTKALTRFTLPWRWDGKPALLESRVDRRDRLCAADHYAAAQAARHEFDLSQQFDPDLAGQAGRERLRCPARVSRAAARRRGLLRAAERGARAARARSLRLRHAGDARADRRLGYRRARPDGAGLPPGSGIGRPRAPTFMPSNARPVTAPSARARGAIPSSRAAKAR